MTAPTAEQFMTGGGKSAKLENVGDVVKGEIIADVEMMQQREYETNDLIFYPDGKPAMQMVIRLQTNERDPDDPHDDGVRCLYVKGQLKDALVRAMRGQPSPVPRRGGKVAVRLSGLEPVTLKNGRKGNDKKIHEARYWPPAVAGADDFMSDAADSGPAATTPPASPTADTTMRAAGNNIQSPSPQWPTCPPGVDPAKWTAMNWDQKSQMYQAFGFPVPEAFTAPPAASRFDDEPPF